MKAILILVVLAIAGIISLLVASSNTGLSVTPAVKTIGLSAPVTVHLTNAHGVRRVDAYLEQNGGNCIVLDHGYGLQSIYGHLREIDVKEGDMVKRGQTMGIAGETGLAGGVHVHFSMQIDGVQINPREWRDEHWIHDRIMSKL